MIHLDIWHYTSETKAKFGPKVIFSSTLLRKKTNHQFTFALSEVGIYIRKQESKKGGKHAFDLERKKKRKRPRKSDSRKKKKGNGKRKLGLYI